MTNGAQSWAGTWRGLRRSPGYAALIIVTLGLALLVLATMFSVVDAVLLQPLPFHDPGRVVALWEAAPAEGVAKFRLSAANFLDLAAQRQVLEKACLFSSDTVRLLSGGEPQQLYGARVGADYFRILGVEPALGRAFAPSDSEPGAPRVVVLSHQLFRQRFGGDPKTVGRSIVLDDLPVTVVGVLPPGLYPTWPLTQGGINFLPEYQQFWVPLVLDASGQTNRRTHVFGALGTLRPGLSPEQAERALAPLAARLRQAFPRTNRAVEFRVVPLADELVGSSRRLLWILLFAAILIVAVATANLAGVALSRAVAHRFETAVRVSLGAARWTLVRDACREALLLATVGSATGLFLAQTLRPLLLASLHLDIPRLGEARITWLVAAVTFGVAAVSAIVVGSAQVFGVAAARPDEVLRRSGFGMGGTAAHRRDLHHGLVVVQVAISVILVSLAGLFARSWWSLTRVEPGFSPTGVLTAQLELPAVSYRNWERIVGFQHALIEQLEQKPSVLAAAVAYDPPLSSSWSDSFTLLDDGRAEDESGAVSAQLNIVSADFLRAAGIRLRVGRPLSALDDRAHPGAALVSASFARAHYPAGGALGRRIRSSTPARMWTEPVAPSEFRIVGVVDDVHSHGLDGEVTPTVYLPSTQFPQASTTILVRVAGDPQAFSAELRHAVALLDRTLPLQHLSSLPQEMDRQLAQPRFALALVSLFGGGSLLLATLGIYGLLALVIRYRTRDFAVRFAVGARPSQVARQVLGETFRLTAWGVGIGLLGSLASAQGLRSLLFGVAGDDPLVVGLTAAVLFVTTGLAAWGPVRRAARIEPALALRA